MLLIDISTLSDEVQQQISQVQDDEEVRFVNHGKILNIFVPKTQKVKNTTKKGDFVSAYDYVMSLDMDERLADIEFDLPKLEAENAEVANKKPSLYDIFANADPAVADIDFELPPRTISNRPIPFEDE